MLGTAPFEGLARKVAESLGLPDVSLAVIEHPLGGITPDEVEARARSIVGRVVELLTTSS